MAKKKSVSQWTKAEEKQIRQTVKAFNKKVGSLRRRKNIGQFMPSSIDVRKLLKYTERKSDMKTLMKQLSTFTSIPKGAKIPMYTNKQGVTMTEWERQKIKTEIKRENARRTQIRKQIEKSDVYDFQGNLIPNAKRQQMKYENVNIKRTPENIRTQAGFKSFAEGMERRLYGDYNVQKAENMKQSLITSLSKEWGYSADDIITVIENMSAKEVHDLYLKHSDILTPDYVYSKLSEYASEMERKGGKFIDFDETDYVNELRSLIVNEKSAKKTVISLVDELKSNDPYTVKLKNKLKRKPQKEILRDFDVLSNVLSTGKKSEDIYNILIEQKIL